MAESKVQRINQGWLTPLEAPALAWLARRMPPWITPDILTGIGFAGLMVSAVSYAFSGWQPALLWLASAGLLINWFGDSLDGTLARYRRIERPRYGYFLDQNIDALAQYILAIGIGLSGYIRFEFSLLAIAAYFMISILSFTRALVSRVFAITYAGVGPTEIRVAFATWNALMFFFPPTPLNVYGALSYADLLALLWTGSIVISFLISFRAELRRLAQEEPPRTPQG